MSCSHGEGAKYTLYNYPSERHRTGCSYCDEIRKNGKDIAADTHCEDPSCHAPLSRHDERWCRKCRFERLADST